MNNSFYLRLLLFFLWLEILFIWLSFKNYSLIILGILNTVTIIMLFFNLKFIKLDFSKYKIDNKTKNNEVYKSILKLYKHIIRVLKYAYLKWFFVISIIILIIAILDKIIFHKFWFNLIYSIFFFLIWLILIYEDIARWEIYLWNRLVNNKDITFILSIIISITIFTLLKWFYLYERIFYSLTIWFVFYIFTILWLNYTNNKLNFFKSTPVSIYLLFIISSAFLFAYKKFPQIKKLLVTEKVVYKDKVIYKDKIVYKEPIKEKITSKFYTAPNWKTYEIFIWSWYVYFTWYNWKKKYFDNYNQAILLINKLNPKNSNKIYKENNNTKNNQIIKNENNSMSNTSSYTDSILSVMNSLLNDDNSIKVTNLWQNKYLTYNDIIPFIVKKYSLSTSWKDIILKFISRNNSNYKYFKIAYYHKMFGKYSNPSTKVRCRNFAVLIWLAEWRNINYTKENVFSLFRNKAIEKWYNFNTCCKNMYDYLTNKKKICILK